jgi:hypothetical protein
MAMIKDIYSFTEQGDADKIERVALSVADLKYLRNSLLKLKSSFGETKEMRRMIGLITTKLLF